MQTLDVNIKLMPDTLDSFSEINNFWVSCLVTSIILLLFVLTVYYFILPEHVRHIIGK